MISRLDLIDKCINDLTYYKLSSREYNFIRVTAIECDIQIKQSIGSCDTCYSRTEEGGCEIYESLKPDGSWYCADYQVKIN